MIYEYIYFILFIIAGSTFRIIPEWVAWCIFAFWFPGFVMALLVLLIENIKDYLTVIAFFIGASILGLLISPVAMGAVLAGLVLYMALYLGYLIVHHFKSLNFKEIKKICIEDLQHEHLQLVYFHRIHTWPYRVWWR